MKKAKRACFLGGRDKVITEWDAQKVVNSLPTRLLEERIQQSMPDNLSPNMVWAESEGGGIFRAPTVNYWSNLPGDGERLISKKTYDFLQDKLAKQGEKAKQLLLNAKQELFRIAYDTPFRPLRIKGFSNSQSSDRYGMRNPDEPEHPGKDEYRAKRELWESEVKLRQMDFLNKKFKLDLAEEIQRQERVVRSKKDHCKEVLNLHRAGLRKVPSYKDWVYYGKKGFHPYDKKKFFSPFDN